MLQLPPGEKRGEEKREGCPPLLSVADSNHPLILLTYFNPPF